MKKVLAILLTLCLLLSMTACGGTSAPASGSAEPAAEAEAEPAPEDKTEAVQEAAPEATAEAATETAQEAATEAAQKAATEAPAEAATEAPAEAATEAPAEAATEAPAEAATEAPAEAAAELETAVGSYKLTDITVGSGSNLEFISAAMGLGVNVYLILEEDNTGHLDFLEAKMPLKWEDGNIKIKTEDSTSEDLMVPYTCEDDTLLISSQAYSMEFTRMTDEDLTEYKANGSGSLTGIIGTMIQGLLDNMDGDLLGVLASGLGQGLAGSSRAPIPEGEPSAETVSAAIDGQEFAILGTDRTQDEDGEIIVFYYDVTNNSDLFRHSWEYSCDASQGGSFLEDVYVLDGIPELNNNIHEIAPGRTIRCASAYTFDPDGGVVSFRISSSEDESTLLYYIDPANLSGAPEPFAFDTDPSIPEYLKGFPEETDDLRIDKTEFYKDEDGNDYMRVFFYFKNSSEETLQMSDVYACMAIQDGIELNSNWDDDVEESDNHMVDVAPGEEILIARAYKLRTGSPVAFVVFVYREDYTVIDPVLSKTVEIQ